MESSATTHARGIGENKFRGRILLLPSVQRPAFVVQVEDRRNGNQIHVGFVIGLDGADIAPVGFFFFIFIAEIVGEDAMLFDDARDDVLAEIVIWNWDLRRRRSGWAREAAY